MTLPVMQAPRREFRSLPALLWVSFRGASGAVIGVLGIAATLGAWFVSPKSAVPLAWFVGLAMIAVVFVVTLTEATCRALQQVARPLPNVRLAVDEETNAGSLVLVLEESTLFSTTMAVSMSLIEKSDYEIHLGAGYVETVREDGRIQVRIVNFADGREEFLQKVRQNDASVLKNIRVKPFLQWQPVFADGAP